LRERGRGVLVVALVLWAAVTTAAEGTALRVGAVTARPGEKASGDLVVPDGVDPGLRIPVTVVHGARPGPVLALVAGTHGYEYPPVLALQRLRARLDPAALAGSVILVHLANPATFYGRRIYTSPDGKNLNRVYPGRADGTLSERIAFAITSEVVAPATHLVDLHCGDGNESLRPYAYWQVTGDARLDEVGKQILPTITTLTYIDWRSQGFSGTLFMAAEEGAVPRASPFRILLSREEMKELSRRANKYTLPYYQVIRAKMILLAHQGLSNDRIADHLATRREIVSMWRKRFFEQRLQGLDDRPRPGRPRVFPPRAGRSR